jgi:hypothetical protein
VEPLEPLFPKKDASPHSGAGEAAGQATSA